MMRCVIRRFTFKDFILVAGVQLYAETVLMTTERITQGDRFCYSTTASSGVIIVMGAQNKI